jgi:PKD repeat protein
MHGATGCAASISTGEAYLRSVVPGILTSAAFTTGRGALFVTFDEGNGYCPLNGGSADCLYASWSGPQAQKGKSSAISYSHYSWLKTVEKNWGLASLQANDAAASDMTEYLTGTSLPTPLQIVFAINPLTATTNTPISFSAVATGGLSPYAFNWNFGDLFANCCGPNMSHSYTTAGSYTVSVRVQDNSVPQQFATATGTVTITNPVPALTASFTISPTAANVGQTVTFTSNVGGGIQPYTISWNFADGQTGIGSTIVHSFDIAGTYTVSMDVSDSASPPNAVTSTGSITVQQPNTGPLTAGFGWTPSVPIVNLQVTFTAIVTGGTQPYIYSWAWGDGTVGINNGGNPITHTYGTPGVYVVTLTVTDAAARPTSVTHQVTVQNAQGTGGSGGSALGLWLVFTIAGLVLIVAPVLTFRRLKR